MRTKLDDEFILFDDQPTTPDAPTLKPWSVLVVDDDPQVHAATRLVLARQSILGRRIQLFEAQTSVEARHLIRDIDDLAVILLDVVIESNTAGLQLIRAIREDYGMEEVRIILRTGQPGSAPELEVIEQFDINDYETKQELTHNRLVTALTAALRSYQQIKAINRSRLGLRHITQASSALSGPLSEADFSLTILEQAAQVLQVPVEGFVAIRRIAAPAATKHLTILGTTESFAAYRGRGPNEVAGQPYNLVARSLASRANGFDQHQASLYIKSDTGEAICFLDFGRTIENTEQQLLEVFGNTIAISYQNLSLIQRLEYSAYFDIITGLPNRVGFIRELDTNWAEPAKVAGKVLVMIDINHFSDISDGLGQETGNLLLKAVADRLKADLPNCLVARVSVDVFAVLGDAEHINPERVLGLFNRNITAGEHTMPLTVNLGFCQALDHGEAGSWLYKRAGIALNRSKKNQRTKFEYYQSEMDDQVRRQLVMIHQLRTDFNDKRLEVWYQPQIRLSDRKITGLEALLRWPKPNGPMISPEVFIPMAESSGLIVDIGAWVMERACETLAALHAKVNPDLSMAVNVSMTQFRSSDFVQRVRTALEKSNLSPQSLRIEVTESVVMDDPALVAGILNQLRTMGVGISLDDFGTGFSAMSYLQALPIDSLKIDRSFVSRLDTSAGKEIVRTVIALGQTLDMEVVAEGVETAAQEAALVDLGCGFIQGFLLAKPMPELEVIGWLTHAATKT